MLLFSSSCAKEIFLELPAYIEKKLFLSTNAFFLIVGVDLSPKEIASYESSDRFFIPSFTSTSKTSPFEGKNTIFHVDISPQWSKFCMEITPELTDYPSEDEILFSCYNVYRYHRTEKCGDQRIIKLCLLDYEQNFDYQVNSFKPVAYSANMARVPSTRCNII